MTFLDVVLVAIVWGLTEVLPLGASGHFALVPGFFPSDDIRAALTVAADGGIAVALALYLWRDLWGMGVGVVRMAKGRRDPGAQLLFKMLAGSVPAAVLMLVFQNLGAGFGSITAASAAMVVFGLMLWGADRMGVTVCRVEHMSLPAAAAIGLLQVAALITGASAVGVVITAQRLLGYERRSSARFALLLALPVTAAHGIYTLTQVSQRVELSFSSDLMLVGGIAGAAALTGTALLMAWLQRHSFAPLALWRVGLGGGMLVMAFLAQFAVE